QPIETPAPSIELLSKTAEPAEARASPLEAYESPLEAPPSPVEPSQTHLKPSQTRLNPLSRSSPHLTAFKPASPRASGPHRVRHQLGLAHTGVPQAGGFPRPQRRTESSKTQPGAADEPAASPI